MICSTNGHVKCLALLSDKGADLNMANMEGTTAAHVACHMGHFKCLQLLIRRGANINIKDAGGLTPLDYARGYKERECIHLLVTNCGVGMRMEELPLVPEAYKVRVSIYLRNSVRCLRPCAHLIFVHAHSLLRNKSPESSKKRRISREKSDNASTRRVWSRPRTGRS